MNSPSRNTRDRLALRPQEAQSPSAAPSVTRGVNGRAKRLGPHKRAKARGLPPGRRTVTVWDVEGDDSVLIQLKTGKQDPVQFRLSGDAFDALCSLRHPKTARWEYVARLMDKLGDGLPDEDVRLAR
jgi:hypothetical protein